MIKMNLVKLMASLFIVFVAFACGGDDLTAPVKTLFEIQGENGFVGMVEGTNAFIALLVTNEEALVYVCNGEEEIYEWFRGSIADPEHVSLSNNYGNQVVADFDGNLFTGTVVLSDKSSHAFEAIPNTGNETGIFQVYGEQATQEGVVAGWILNAKNEERGSFRLNSVFQATPIKPKTSTISFKNNSFSIRRFSFIYHPDSISVIQTNR